METLNYCEYPYIDYCFLLKAHTDSSFKVVTEGYTVGFAAGGKLTKLHNSKLICVKNAAGIT